LPNGEQTDQIGMSNLDRPDHPNAMPKAAPKGDKVGCRKCGENKTLQFTGLRTGIFAVYAIVVAVVVVVLCIFIATF